MPLANEWIAGADQQTVGAVAVTVAQYALAANVSVYVEGDIVGRTAAGDTVAAKIAARFKSVASVLSQIGATVNLAVLAGDALVAASVVAFDTNGSNVRLRATGVAAQNITWSGNLKVTVQS